MYKKIIHISTLSYTNLFVRLLGHFSASFVRLLVALLLSYSFRVLLAYLLLGAFGLAYTDREIYR